MGRQSARYPFRARRVHDRDVRARRDERGAARGESLTGFAIPTLGAAIWTNENGRGLLLGASANGATMLIITSVECAMALAFVWLVKRMQRDQSKAIDDMDVSNISLQDYSVKVDDVLENGDAGGDWHVLLQVRQGAPGDAGDGRGRAHR